MKTILCYGDSNAYGQIGGGEERFPWDVRWTGRLQALLGSDCRVIEEGLGGRTTVWDDPVEEHKNGKQYLLPCLASHKPLDLVVLMLGTNDLKKRFGVSSFDIGVSIEVLLRTIAASGAGHGAASPPVLLVPPVPIQDVGNLDFNRMLEGGVEKSRQLAPYYQQAARKAGVHYLEVSDIELCKEDGVHFTAAGHAHFAETIAGKVREILSDGNQV